MMLKVSTYYIDYILTHMWMMCYLPTLLTFKYELQLDKSAMDGPNACVGDYILNYIK